MAAGTANPQKALRSKGFPAWLPGRAVGARELGNPRKSGASHFFYSLIITGSMVVETVFTVGGLGSQFVSAINNRDYTLIMATTIFLAFLASLMVIATLVCDLLYKAVDPRIQYD